MRFYLLCNTPIRFHNFWSDYDNIWDVNKQIKTNLNLEDFFGVYN